MKKKYKIIFMHVLVFLLIFSSFSNIISAVNVKVNDPNNDENSKNSYILEFKEKPLLEFKNDLKDKFKNLFSNINSKSESNFIKTKIIEYKNKLKSLQLTAKNEILKLFDNAQNDNIFKYEFTKLLNGVVVEDINSKIIEKIRKLPFIKRVSKDNKIKANIDDVVNIIRANKTWKLKDDEDQNINGKNISVAILDTGVNFNHPDLVDNYCEGGYDYINEDSVPFDDEGHGTGCAGAVVGIAPNVNIYAYKILDDQGEGIDSDAIACIEDIIDPNGDGDTSDCFIDIISMSFGNNSTQVTPDDPLCLVVDQAVDLGIIAVAAAGNDGRENTQDRINSPGCARKTITVGASTKNDNVADYSSWGPVIWDDKYLEKPDVVAPGSDIVLPYLGTSYRTRYGTSFSTPIISGSAALLLQAHSNWSAEKIKNKLKEYAVDLGEPVYKQGAGRIDIFKTLEIDEDEPEEKDKNLTINVTNFVFEENFFSVKLTKNEKSISAFVIFLPFLHMPQIRYGSEVEFTAPKLHLGFVQSISAKIIVIKLLDKEIKKTNITILNKI